MVHAAVRPGDSGPARPGLTRPGLTRGGVPAAARRLDLATTPGRLRLLLAGLVLLSLAWGALAAFTAVRYASAASSVVAVREPLSLDAQQIYSKLSDANDAAVTAFLTVGVEPAATRQRYLGDISAASTGIERATAQGGAVTGTAAADLSTLAQQLPAYTGEIETARADNRLGLPVGAAYLREAAGLMRDTLLPRGRRPVRGGERGHRRHQCPGDRAAAGRGDPGGGPGRRLPAVPGVALAPRAHQPGAQPRPARRRPGRRHLLWSGWPPPMPAPGATCSDARARGSATVEAVAEVSIAAQEAHADESLTLIDNTGNDKYPTRTTPSPRQAALGPGAGTLLGAARAAAQGTPAPSRR